MSRIHDTPRTDAVLNTFDGNQSKLAADLATHAEELERELTDMKQEAMLVLSDQAVAPSAICSASSNYVRYVRWDLVERLLRDVMQIHADPNDAGHNQCDEDKCQWCQWASELFPQNA